MTSKIVAVLIIAALAVVFCKPDEKSYTTKYDNVDIDQILKNDRLLNNYVQCLLNKGTCTPDAAELKGLLPDALSNACEHCNEKQKEGSRKVLTFLIENKEDVYEELEKVYDTTGEYKKKYCKLAKEEGLTVKTCQ